MFRGPRKKVTSQPLPGPSSYYCRAWPGLWRHFFRGPLNTGGPLGLVRRGLPVFRGPRKKSPRNPYQALAATTVGPGQGYGVIFFGDLLTQGDLLVSAEVSRCLGIVRRGLPVFRGPRKKSPRSPCQALAATSATVGPGQGYGVTFFGDLLQYLGTRQTGVLPVFTGTVEIPEMEITLQRLTRHYV